MEQQQTKYVTLGKTNLKINPIGLGCMGMSAFYQNKPTEEDAIKVIHRALELGVNFFDTAYVYGWGHNEELLGKAIKSAITAGKVKRDDVVIATKFGFDKTTDGMGFKVTSNADVTKRVVDECIKRLDLGQIDLLYQHRVDPEVPIENVVRQMAEFVKEGKVKALGLSEASAATLRKAHAIHPISALQTEYSLWSTEPESNGTLETCRELGVTFVAYSPLGRGFLTGALKTYDDLSQEDFRRRLPRFSPENFQKNIHLVEEIKKLAKAKGVTPGQLALAWVLRQPGVVTIPGTTKIPNLEENVGAAKVHITEQDDKEIRKLLDSLPVIGMRYDPQFIKYVSL
jgi:aryl-alcohol dehydrogenase-like predicted oxidoreductase